MDRRNKIQNYGGIFIGCEYVGVLCLVEGITQRQFVMESVSFAQIAVSWPYFTLVWDTADVSH